MTSADWRDAVEAMDVDLVPHWRTFPVESYTAILKAGKAAATPKRYVDKADAERDVKTVCKLLSYYREWHPELAPTEYGRRLWQSKEDGRWRWAIMPTRQRRRVTP